MKVLDYSVRYNEHKGIQLRLYVSAAPTGGGTPSRVFEMDIDTAKAIGHDLSFVEVEL